ncbi:MAG TPA: serine hydrolase domain-containing protein [Kofleriaceae bacterium]|nr:serine hydrolase domain-containing protein [Kofleriaceae bacterium]
MRIGALCLAGVVALLGLYGTAALVGRVLDDGRLARSGLEPLRAVDPTDPGDAAPDRAAPPADLDGLRAQIAEIMQRNQIAGAGIALVDRDGVRWAGGIGLADRERGIPVTADTLFRVGSITKTFLVLAVMQLVERGRLDLAAPVAQLAPEIAFDNRWAAEQPITVAHLLEHTAGFDEMRPNETFAPREAEAMSLYDVLARNPASRVARWRPGSRASYSNPGYTLAAYILEKLTGQPYEQVIERELFQPLGMTHAALRMTSEVGERLARGYDERDRPVAYRGIYHRPAGNLMVSARDLAALIQLALARGRVGGAALVSPATIDRIERSETAELDSGDASYGLANWGDVSMRVVLRGHGGYAPGFLALYGYSASRGVGYVLLLNSTRSHDGRFEIRRAIVDYLLRDQPVPPPPRVQIPEPELQRWAGSYHLAASRMQLMAFRDRLSPGVEVFVDRGRLYTRPLPGDEPPRELIPVGGDRFRAPWASGSFVAFGHDRDGRRIYLAGSDYFLEEPRSRTLAFALGPVICIALLGTGLVLPLTGFVRRRRPAPGIGWPVVVALSLFLAPRLFAAAIDRGVFGELNVYTAGLFVLSLVFPLGSLATAVQTLAWLPRPGSILGKLHRALFSAAACCVTGYLAAYGLIGIRMWSY